jgi:hypothetical protein
MYRLDVCPLSADDILKQDMLINGKLYIVYVELLVGEKTKCTANASGLYTEKPYIRILSYCTG